MRCEARLEKRRDLLWLLPKLVPLGEVPSVKTIYSVGKSHVSVFLDQNSETLLIRSQDEPVKLKFAAEPKLARPAVTEWLHKRHPEFTTGMSKIAIYSEIDPTQRLVLKVLKPHVTPTEDDALLLARTQTTRFGLIFPTFPSP